MSQSFVKQSVDIPEHHSIALSVLMAQRIAGWSRLDSKVVETTSYALQSLADIAQRLAVCHMAEQQSYKVRPGVESLAIFI